MSAEERPQLRKLGLTIGSLDIFHHQLLKPEAVRWRAALLAAVIGAVEKQQMFEKMRQAWVRGRLIMTARRHPHTDRRLSTAHPAEHSQLQPIGQARANLRGSRDGR